MSRLDLTISVVTTAAEKQIKKLKANLAGLEKRVHAPFDKGRKSANRFTLALRKLGKVAKGVFLGNVLFQAFNLVLSGFRDLVGATAKFEDALIGVGKVADISGKELSSLGGEIEKLSKTIPISADKLLDITQTAARLGVRGTKDLVKFTDTIARLAAVSDLEGNRAALVLARLLNITGESTDSVDKLGSAIVKLGNNFATSESEIADVALDIARGTARFNIASKDILGIATALKETGAQSEISGSQIGFLFTKVTEAISDGGPKLEAYAKITGKTGEELRNLIDSDPTEILLSVTEGLKGLEGNAVATENAMKALNLNNLRIKKVVPSLVKNFDNLKKALRFANEEYKESNELTRVSEKVFASTTSTIKFLGNELTIAARILLDELIPATKAAVKGLTGIIRITAKGTAGFVGFGKAIGELAGRFHVGMFGTKTEKQFLFLNDQFTSVSRKIDATNEKIKEQQRLLDSQKSSGSLDLVAKSERELLILKIQQTEQLKQQLKYAKQLGIQLDKNGKVVKKEDKDPNKDDNKPEDELNAIAELDKLKLERKQQAADKELATQNSLKQQRDAKFFESEEEAASAKTVKLLL